MTTSIEKPAGQPSNPHILVIDDDTKLRQLLKKFLIGQGFLVTSAENAAQARSLLQNMSFDALVLDIMMPGESGLALTESIRNHNPQSHSTVPILLLSALGETENRIEGLGLGADDYLPKPFEPRELVARLNSLLRRTKPQQKHEKLATFGDFTFNLATNVLLKSKQPISLSGGEAAILSSLAMASGDALSRETLAEKGQSARAIDVQINRLRKKIEPDQAHPQFLQTIRGTGYQLVGVKWKAL